MLGLKWTSCGGRILLWHAVLWHSFNFQVSLVSVDKFSKFRQTKAFFWHSLIWCFNELQWRCVSIVCFLQSSSPLNCFVSRRLGWSQDAWLTGWIMWLPNLLFLLKVSSKLTQVFCTDLVFRRKLWRHAGGDYNHVYFMFEMRQLFIVLRRDCHVTSVTSLTSPLITLL